MSGIFRLVSISCAKNMRYIHITHIDKKIEMNMTGNNNKKQSEGNTCVHTWMQGGEDVSLAGYLGGTFVVNVNSELVRLLNGRRRNGNVSYDNVGAFLPEYSSLGLNHSVLFGVVA